MMIIQKRRWYHRMHRKFNPFEVFYWFEFDNED